MPVEKRFKRLRGVLGNAMVWGLGWATAAFGIFAFLHVTGNSDSSSWLDGVELAAKTAIIGAIAGGAFSTVIRVAYRGRRLSEISWVRFGIAGWIATSVFVPLFLQTMNLFSGDGLVAWPLVLDDGLWTGILGGVAAAVSLKLAQVADTVLHKRDQNAIDPSNTVENLTAAWERDIRATELAHPAPALGSNRKTP
jgi:hypothetical protein